MGCGGPHGSPQAQGLREVDLTKTLAWLEEARETTGQKITVTHVFVAAVGRMLREYPDFNVILRRNRPYVRDTVDVFVQVAVKGADGKADLSGIKVRDVNTKSIGAIASDIAARAGRVRAGQDKDIEQAKAGLRFIPPMALPPLMKVLTSLSYDWGLDLSKIGIKPDPFGSCMVTNVGGFGIPHALVPLLPTSRVPMLFCLGKIHDRPRVIDGKIAIVPSLLLTGSFDHRLFDGFQIGKMTTLVDQIASDPGAWDLL